MHTPDFSHTATIAKEIGWHDELSKLRDELLARGLVTICSAKAVSIKRKLCGGRASICGQRNVLLPAAWRSAISAKFAWLRKRTGLCANATVLRDGMG